MHEDEVRMLQKIRNYLSPYSSAVIAFSGGVDSSTLAAVCKDEIRTLAVTVLAKNIPSREIRQAKEIADEIGVKHEFLRLDILSNKNFVRNGRDRCYHCKKYILSKLAEHALRKGYEVVFEGTNTSDAGDDRPGMRAIAEIKGVKSPWLELGFCKDDIRRIARSLGYSFHSKPSLACLATRIPYGVRITENDFKMVDAAENAVIELAGAEQVRVRKIGGAAVIEVERSDVRRVLSAEREIVKVFKEIGFKDVFVDLEGYRTGKGSVYCSFNSSHSSFPLSLSPNLRRL